MNITQSDKDAAKDLTDNLESLFSDAGFPIRFGEKENEILTAAFANHRHNSSKDNVLHYDENVLERVTRAIDKKWNELEACGSKDLALAALIEMQKEIMKLEDIIEVIQRMLERNKATLDKDGYFVLIPLKD